MIFLLFVVFIGAYAVAASWAVCHGLGRLWSTAAASLLLIVVGGILLGRYYSVPSLSRLLFYMMALTAPLVFVPTAMLSFSTTPKTTLAKSLPTAIFGACIGFLCGWVVVVYALRVW